MPTGNWYFPDIRGPGNGRPGATHSNIVQRRPPGYIPYQSMTPDGARYGYGYQAGQDYPRRVNGGGGYQSWNDWTRLRPRNEPYYNIIPLGVRGMTEGRDYSWGGFNNNGRGGYTPPDREHGPMPRQRRRRGGR